jgi:predicted nucleic acid-binding protein
MPTNESVFVDTWALLALANRKDNFHQIAVGTYETLLEEGCKLVVSDYVLDETITSLFKNVRFDDSVKFIETLLEAIKEGQISLKMIDAELFGSAWLLRKIYRDKPDISFTDLTSFVVMRDLGIVRAFTRDLHFEQVGLGLDMVPKL